MRKIALFIGSIIIVSCSSTTSLEDVEKQEEEARSELLEAKEEMVELAETKEEYSVDSRDEMIKTLEKRRKMIKSDIKSLNNVESSTMEQGTKVMIADLEEQDQNLEKKMERLKDKDREDWESTKDSINMIISDLQKKIDQITANLEEDK